MRHSGLFVGGVCAALCATHVAAAELIVLREALSEEDRFYLANPATGAVGFLGGVTDRFAGIAANRDGRLIGVGRDGLVREVNYRSFGTTETGASVAGVRGVAHNGADDRFYALSDGAGAGPQVFWFDPDSGATGGALTLGAFADGSQGAVENFYFDQSGSAIVSVTEEDSNGSLRTERFYAVDMTTGAGELILTISADPESFTDYDPFVTRDSGLAWATVNDGLSQSFSFGELRLDPLLFDDSAFVDVINSPGGFPPFVSDGAIVPSPGGAALLLIGGAGLLRRRR